MPTAANSSIPTSTTRLVVSGREWSSCLSGFTGGKIPFETPKRQVVSKANPPEDPCSTRHQGPRMTRPTRSSAKHIPGARPALSRSRLAACLLCLFLLACRREAPSTPPVVPLPPEPVYVESGGGWLFVYATSEGTFATTDQASDVPAESRGVVRALEPKPSEGSPSATGVWVVNLAQVMDAGRAPARRVAREVFETQALARLPPGDSSRLAERPAAEPTDQAIARAKPGGDRRPDVTLYGTSWCGACRSARQYFLSHDIPFVDKDVEKDLAAADELRRKAAALGVDADRVPILEVRGRLLIGFDPRRVEALLGETI